MKKEIMKEEIMKEEIMNKVSIKNMLLTLL